MLHPVGSHTPSVYWRRRLLLFGSLALVVVLIVLTLRAVLGGDGGDPAAAGTPSGSASVSGTGSAPASPTGTASSVAPTSSAAHRSTSAGGSSGPPGRAITCPAKQLDVAAKVGKSSYSVGDQPVLMLQVTNTGPGPCVQDLADRQVVLEVYNGASRVWGSHDCKIEPGVHDRTLAVDQPVRVSIVWSGLSSRPHCAGTRQRVGAGTYTLYATLSGNRGTAAQFSIS